MVRLSEIMINGAKDIFIERAGRLERLERQFSSEAKLNDIIQFIVALNNQIVNESSPIVDTRLPDGSFYPGRCGTGRGAECARLSGGSIKGAVALSARPLFHAEILGLTQNRASKSPILM